MVRNSFILVFLFLSVHLFAQQPTQTIRGTVIDDASNVPIPFATVGLQNTGFGTLTDSVGNFIIKDVPVGSYNIIVTSSGFAPLLLNGVQVGSAKEVLLNISLKGKTNTLNEVVITPKVNKELPLNSMAMASARMLSVDEASRYAGGFDDPARLVSAFAGVSSDVGDNAIVVRGNSPQSLQWKLEGVEISNPNHFADVTGAFGGGGLTALSTQLLANSDFLSGAMPAEYNNALSGVFDIFMRNGNNQEHENTFQVGVIGIDAASEGPFKKGKNSSYIFNYRYSTLGLLVPILPENAGGTTYQDLSFKLNFPTLKAGTFSLWGIGLLDHSGAEAKDSIKEWKYDSDRQNQNVDQYMGAIGLSHKIFISEKQFVKSTLALTANGIDMHTEELDSSFNALPKNVVKNNYYNFVLTSFLNTKFGERHTNKTGFVFTNMNYNMLLENAPVGAPLNTLVNSAGKSNLVAAYTSSKVEISDKFLFTAGVNGQWFTYNNTFSLEPRLGLKYNLTPTQSFSFAYGLYSRLERLNYYFLQDNNNQFINKNLGFTRAQHFVLGYDISPSEFTHLKVEAYFQNLFDVPVMAGNSFSLINQQDDWFFDGQLQNTGLGKNYGVDITFEKYLSGGYYYMATLSLFRSRYQGGDGVWRDTRFDRDIASNFLIGKEWTLGKNQNHILSLNARVSFQGGDHYTPINTALSESSQSVIFDDDQAYSLQYAPAFTSHFTASYKINKRKTAHEFALKIINLTQYKDYQGFLYNYQTNSVDVERQAIFIPNLSYKFEF